MATSEPHLIDASALALARAVLDDLSRQRLNGSIFATIAERAHEPLLPGDVAVAAAPLYLNSEDTLEAALGTTERSAGSGRVRLIVQSPAQTLRETARKLPPDVVLALDVLLRRAIDPPKALITWPRSALFTTGELELIHSLEEKAEVSNFAANRERVTLIIKLTRLCNLRCTYCHDWEAGPDRTMSFSVLASLFHKALSEPSYAQLAVAWHGGEPTLVKPRRFLQALWLQEHFRRPGQRIKNNLQTNGTLIDSTWAKFLARYRFGVSVSIDGPAALHDESRPSARGGRTFASVRRGVTALRDAGLQPSALIVIGPKHLELGAERLVAFLRDEGLQTVSLLAMRPAAGEAGRSELIFSTGDYMRLLLDVDRVLGVAPGPPIVVRELKAVKAALAGSSAVTCEFAGACAGYFYTIEPDGSVSHCDKYFGDRNFTVGNILNDDFGDFSRGTKLAAIKTSYRQASMRKEAACPYFRFCRGWCPHEHYVAESAGGSPAACCGLAPLFQSFIAAESSMLDAKAHPAVGDPR